MLICFQEFQLMHENNLILICSEKSHFQNEKHHENLILWQIDDLMSMLVNKLATVILETDRQYNYHIRETDFEIKNLIWVLSLQIIIWLKIILTTNDFILFKEALKSFSQKTVFFDVFIREIVFFNNFIKKSTLFNNFNAREKKSSIFNLIKNVQEFDLLCR